MSEHEPAAGTPEYLEHAGGSPLGPEPQAGPAAGGPPRGRRRTWWIAGAVIVLLGAGAGAWAALSFFRQGEQPAQALPASTVAYLSVDLDPSGGQKIDAFRTLNKFPAFKHHVGVDTVDALRHKLGDVLIPSGCRNLDFDHDVDPWLGSRAAVALVALPGSHPATVLVVQVKDDRKARDGISALDACATGGGLHPTGLAVHNGWAVMAQTQQVADQVVAAADQANLADDAAYQKWTKAVGDAGVVNAYAAPDAGHYLAQRLGGLLGGGGLLPGGFVTPGQANPYAAPSNGFVQSSADTTSSVTTDGDPFGQALSNFKGGAATLRFTGDGLELAVAADGGGTGPATSANTGGALVQRLPDDTAVAVGASLSKGWVERRLDSASGLYGGLSRARAMRQLSRLTGLDLPGDLETLLGSGVSLSVGRDFDFEAAQNSTTGSGLPVAATVKGDPAAIDRVLAKLRAKVGDLGALGSDSAGDLDVIGPTPAYRQHVLRGGSLGDDDTFRSVVPDAGAASAVVYLNIDAIEPQIAKALSSDQASLSNLTPLRAIGWSTWNDGGTRRFSFRVTTN